MKSDEMGYRNPHAGPETRTRKSRHGARGFDLPQKRETKRSPACAAGFGLELSPTWQYKNLYARLSVGYLHLTNTGGAGYGNNGNGRDVVQSGLEGGVLF